MQTGQTDNLARTRERHTHTQASTNNPQPVTKTRLLNQNLLHFGKYPTQWQFTLHNYYWRILWNLGSQSAFIANWEIGSGHIITLITVIAALCYVKTI
jgi:hypothetical protein